MSAETTVTVGMVILAFTIAGGTWKIVAWLNGKWAETEEKILKQLSEFRSDVQKSLSAQREEANSTAKELRGKYDELRDELGKHKLYAAETFATKEGTTAGLRAVLEELKAGRETADARLMRIENHLVKLLERKP